MLTPRQGEMLRSLLRGGAVRVRAEINSRIYDGAFNSTTGVSRTSSGLAIDERPSPELNVEGVLALVDRIVASGYLRVKD
jgi:hypothetical protein